MLENRKNVKQSKELNGISITLDIQCDLRLWKLKFQML